jgi:hypothetical protein
MAENGFNFDARIQRLTERHEAIAQSVELFTLDVRELQTQIRLLVAAVEQQHGQFADLLQIAQSHERRLNRGKQ